MARAFFKPERQGLAIEVEIVAPLERSLQVKALSFSNLLVEGDFVVVISYVTKTERGLWLRLIIVIS